MFGLYSTTMHLNYMIYLFRALKILYLVSISMKTIEKVTVISMKNPIQKEMHPIYPFSFKPEYVDEMTVDAETETKHKAGCVWKLLGSRYTQSQLERYCTLYGITTEQALQWKRYWI